jgi:hypothetical protein
VDNDGAYDKKYGDELFIFAMVMMERKELEQQEEEEEELESSKE